MDKSSKLIRTIVEVALFAALGFVLDELQGAIAKAIFPFGGSIGFAIIAVVIVSFRRGPVAGFFTGLIMGFLDFATGPYILNFWQVLLDYIFPYAVVAICGAFKPWFDQETDKNKKLLILLLATFVGGLFKFMSHFLSGGIFFADYISWKEFEGQPWLYSLAYNMAAVGPSIGLTMILLFALYKRVPHVIEVKESITEIKYDRIRWFDFILNPIVVATGIFRFVFYLIQYINSYEGYVDGGAIGAEFNQDALFLFVCGFLLILVGGISQLKAIHNIQNYRLTCDNLLFISTSNLVYAIALIIKRSIKGKDITTYWIWFGVSIFILALQIVLLIYVKKLAKKSEPVKA